MRYFIKIVIVQLLIAIPAICVCMYQANKELHQMQIEKQQIEERFQQVQHAIELYHQELEKARLDTVTGTSASLFYLN